MMETESPALQKLKTYLTAAVAGLFLFMAISSMLLGHALFNAEKQKELFQKYNIYSQVGKVVNSSMHSYLDTLKVLSPGSLKQQEQLILLVDKAVTPDMLKMNVNLFIDGMMKYFKGETYFLPDIYLNPVENKSHQQLQTKVDQDDSVNGQSLTKIDSINSSVLLMYLNRNDIADDLSVVRLLNFITSQLPIFSLLLSLFALLLFFLLSGQWLELIRWLRCAALTCGLIGLFSGLMLYILPYWVLPRALAGYRQYLPLPESVLEGYIQSLLKVPSIILLLFGLLFTVISLAGRLSMLSAAIYRLHSSDQVQDQNGAKTEVFWKIHLKTLICIVLLAVLAVTAAFRAEAAMKEFHSKDLSVVLDRLKGNGIYTRVVAAKDETVYSLQVRTVDKVTSEPIPGVHFVINGKTNGKTGEFIAKGVSDENGISKFAPGSTGTFKLSFEQGSFPKGYSPPSSFVFSMNTPGTTIVTVNLEKAKEPGPGTAEVQVLGSDDRPLGSAELAVGAVQHPPGIPAESYSFTNTEGVAVFRIPEGTYSVSFIATAFPAGYRMPQSFNIDVVSGSTVKYAIKLVQATEGQGTAN